MAQFLYFGGLQPSEFDKLSEPDTVSLAEELTKVVKERDELTASYVELLASSIAAAPRVAL